MRASVRPQLAPVLDAGREGVFLDAMAKGRYHPELLFPTRPDIVKRIEGHPALVWKALNVAQYIAKAKI